MIFKGILLRTTQIVSAATGLFLLLMAGTFFLQGEIDLFNSGVRYLAWSGGFWFLWAILTFLVRRSPIELVREVAIVVYPFSALISLALCVYLGFKVEEMLTNPKHEMWTLIAAGVMIAVVMIVKCLDIQWLRTAEEIRPPRGNSSDLDDEYGPLV